MSGNSFIELINEELCGFLMVVRKVCVSSGSGGFGVENGGRNFGIQQDKSRGELLFHEGEVFGMGEVK